MRNLVLQLVESLAGGQPIVCCRLIETRGSTPQKAGAMMLVYEDGSQQGTLGGGCVEAEVKRRALAVLQRGTSEVARFQLDDDYGWDDGLICGGRMQVLLEPFGDPAAVEYFSGLAQAIDAGQGATEAIVFDQEKSGLSAPSSYLLDRSGNPLAQQHPAEAGNEIPFRVREHLKPLANRPGPYAKDGVAYLPLTPRSRLVIVGGGHVGKAVADLAIDVDFDVWIVDDRAEYVREERFPRAQQRLVGKMGDVLPRLEITSDTYCLIVTRGHNHDEEALYHLVDRGAAYIGMIGSRRKIKLIFDDLLQEDISQKSLQQVFTPVGLDIGSQTVSEIAISIVAELVAHRNCAGRVPGRSP